jgi:hypothetical protein
MKKLLLILLCLPMIGFGQNVNIPDANFKAYLVGNSAINTNGDTEIQVSEATVFNGSIYCPNMNISDLTGIEDFTVLNALYCGGNQLTILDVSQNTFLNELSCGDNNLTSLDVSNNIGYFSCANNQLTSLDVSNNIDLGHFSCANNQLTSLDVRNGNNSNILTFEVTNNPNLTCVNVDNVAWSTANWTVAYGNIDPQNYFSNNCPPSALEEHTTNKELLKVTDLLGRETKQTNQPLFYIYDNGTVEKKIIIK